MDPVASVNANPLLSAEAIEAAQANLTGSSASQSQAQKLGLPPVGLASAAATNTINAQLVSSQWGIDPAAVSGVYGGAAQSAGLFAGDTMLTLLQTLSSADAEQALTLLGIGNFSPSPDSGGSPAPKSATAANAATNAAAAAAVPSSGGSDVGTTVDPLWGVRA
jgi:hypothetical protein